MKIRDNIYFWTVNWVPRSLFDLQTNNNISVHYGSVFFQVTMSYMKCHFSNCSVITEKISDIAIFLRTDPDIGIKDHRKLSVSKKKNENENTDHKKTKKYFLVLEITGKNSSALSPQHAIYMLYMSLTKSGWRRINAQNASLRSL